VIQLNARAYGRPRVEGIPFGTLLWSFVDDEPVVNRPATHAEIPVLTDASIAMSKDLKRRGFTFVGPTICYAFMQNTGMGDDHIADCFLASVVDQRTER